MGTSPFYFTALAHIGSKIEQSKFINIKVEYTEEKGNTMHI